MPSEIKLDILYKAVLGNTSIAMGRYELDKNEFNFSSRFFAYDRDKGVLVVDFPSTTQDIEPLQKKEPIVVYFVHRNSRYIFRSRVMGLTEYQLTDDKLLKALIIAMPEELVDGERRNFFKVATPPHRVDIRIVQRRDSDDEPYEGIVFTGASVNISGGGIAVREDDGHLPFRYGDVISLTILFPDQELIMEGRVVNKYQYENSDNMIFGIEFIQETIDKLSFKRNVNMLMRYVMKRERELLLVYA